MILEVANAWGCGRTTAADRKPNVFSSRIQIDFSMLHFRTLYVACVCLLHCNTSASLLVDGAPPHTWAVLWLCCCEGFQRSVGWLHCVRTDTCDCALESGGLVRSDDSIFHARIYNFLLQYPKCLIVCLFVCFFYMELSSFFSLFNNCR